MSSRKKSKKNGTQRGSNVETNKSSSIGSNPGSSQGSTVTSAEGKKFLTDSDGDAFRDHVRRHYQGFMHIPAKEIVPSTFHDIAKAAFERLRDSGYFQYDIVRAGGKHASRTFVKRTLVGEPGITYKYLGLRLFAHAWSGPGVLPIMKTIGDLNRCMIDMTKMYKDHGNCEYNLTLINFMEPSSHSTVGFKDEAFYGMGKVSVSWHADSSLEKNSSIGVYHCLPAQRSSKWDWKIALRRTPESGDDAKTILPIVTSTKDGDAYFLLGTFNETHQHCVLAGTLSNRISSTHRVAVTEEDTYDYIKKRAKGAIKRFSQQLEGDTSSIDAKVIVYAQRVLTEVELEWIAQYWLQGAEHDKMHVWWQKPMRSLEAMWQSLEELTFQFYQLCVKKPDLAPRLALKGFLNELENRQTQRSQWDERRADKIYQRRIQAPFRPVERPLFDGTDGTRLPKDLGAVIKELLEVRQKQLATTKQNSKLVSSSSIINNGNKRPASEMSAANKRKKRQRR